MNPLSSAKKLQRKLPEIHTSVGYQIGCNDPAATIEALKAVGDCNKRSANDRDLEIRKE